MVTHGSDIQECGSLLTGSQNLSVVDVPINLEPAEVLTCRVIYPPHPYYLLKSDPFVILVYCMNENTNQMVFT